MEIWLNILKLVSLRDLSCLQRQNWLLRHAVLAELERRARLAPRNRNPTIYLKVREWKPRSFLKPFSFFRSNTTRLFRFKPRESLLPSEPMHFGDPEEYVRYAKSFRWEETRFVLIEPFMEMFPKQLLSLYWSFPDPENRRWTGLRIYKADDWRQVFPVHSYPNLDVRSTFNHLRLCGVFCLETASLDETLRRCMHSNSRDIKFPLQPIRQLAGFQFYLAVWPPFCVNCKDLLRVNWDLEPDEVTLELRSPAEYLYGGRSVSEDQFCRGKWRGNKEEVEFFTLLYMRSHPRYHCRA